MSTILERLEYGFDRDSRRTWRKRSLTTGEDNAYGYDGLSQVVNAARGHLNLNATAIGGVPAEAQAWDYDPTGNWRGYETKACFRRHLSAHHAGAAPHSAVAELGVVRRLCASPMNATMLSLGFALGILCSGHCLAVPPEIMPTPTATEEPRIAHTVFINASLREITDFLARKRRELAPHSSPIHVVLDLPIASIDARRISITFHGPTFDEALSALATTIDLRVVAAGAERQLKQKETNPK